MSRSFSVSFDSIASVEEVYSAFRDEGYWASRLAALGGNRTLDSLTVDPDGAVSVVSSEDLRHNALPGLLAKLYRGDLVVVSEERWAPGSDRCVSGEISVAVIGAPGSGHGAASLAPLGVGSRLELCGTVEFNIPVVGGRVENFIASQFVEGLTQIQNFTTRWVAERV